MTGFLPLAFGAPAALLAFLALPAIWWLLRFTPPKPLRRDFPPTVLLRDLDDREETPAHTPWWVLLLRLALAAAVILAFAAPVWRPAVDDDGATGPMWLVVDDGWPAAPGWEATRAAVATRIEWAERRGRPVVLVASAEGADQSFDPVAPGEASRRLATLAPRPRADVRGDLLAGLGRAAASRPPGSVVWFTHGLDTAVAADGRAFAEALATMAGSAPVVVAPPARIGARVLDGVDNGLDALTVKLARVGRDAASEGRLRALDAKGRGLAEVAFGFPEGGTVSEVRIELPTAVRNDVARIEIADEPHAGAVALLDERWRRRVVGLVSGTGFDRAQPLLGPGHYLERAFAPFADLRRSRARETGAAIVEAIEARVSVLVLADVGTVVGEAATRLTKWVEGGGILVRFAGPRLSGGREGDTLLPVEIRGGERTLGGALTWGAPRGLGAFPASGPFAGMTPPADVRVTRQILAEPGPDLGERTWAVLDDGTPLVTAARRGAGRIVLFHVGAETSWSNLSLSGGFVEMLRRITALSAATRGTGETAASTAAALPPWRLLDGFGRLGAPGPEARPIPAAALPERASREHPPGLWGSDDAFVALPTRHGGDPLALIDLDGAAGVTVVPRRPADRVDLAPVMLAVALALAAVDTVIVAWPHRRPRRRLAVGAAVVAVFLAVGPDRPQAAESGADAFATSATRETRLAHVLTGDDGLDEIAHRGLVGLGRVLVDRTAVELGEPIGVDPARDELAFFPLLYYPVAAEAAAISPVALGRLDAFMKNGGTIVFDTRDAADADARGGSGRPTPAGAALRRILAGLDLPELEPVPDDHVLGRTFYLLRSFPGRFDGRMWVEASPPTDPDRPEGRPARPGDGVSPLIVTGNDLAGAWAVADDGDDLLPMAISDPRGREMALRVGVNIVMYTLTGNYKADQVHVPALLQRLGR